MGAVSNNYVIRNHKDISCHYWKSWFLVMGDHRLVTSYPCDSFYYVMTQKRKAPTRFQSLEHGLLSFVTVRSICFLYKIPRLLYSDIAAPNRLSQFLYQLCSYQQCTSLFCSSVSSLIVKS